MTNKKKLPLNLLHLFSSVKPEDVRLIKEAPDEDYIFKLVDKDPQSDFFFALKEIKVLPAKPPMYTVSLKPYVEHSVQPHTMTVKMQELGGILQKWLSNLSIYNKPYALFDNIIEKTYYEEIGVDFFLMDDDKKEAPYSIKEQREISKIYDDILHTVKNYVDEDDDMLNHEINIIIESIKDAQRKMSRETKEEVLTDFKAILAKITYMNRPLGDKIMTDVFCNEAKKILMSNHKNVKMIDSTQKIKGHSIKPSRR